jgi:mono/diheme cytochrome c family protein
VVNIGKLSLFICLLILFVTGCNDKKTEHVKLTVDDGEAIFKESCIACHSTDNIIGGSFKLQSTKLKKDYKDQESLYQFIFKYMPENNPGSLTEQEYEAIVKYLWLHKS